MTASDLITKRQRYELLRSQLWNERSSFDALHREVGLQVNPVRPRFTLSDKNKGDRRNQQIIDNTGITCKNRLRASMHAGLTSPARQWFELSTADQNLADDPDVKQWLFDLTQQLHRALQISNAYNAFPQVYDDMITFGTAALAVFPDPDTIYGPGSVLNCETYPVGQYAFSVNRRRRVSTFVREYALSILQLIETFGGEDGGELQARQTPDWSRFSPRVKTAYDRGDYVTQVDVCWIVTPNLDYQPDSLDARQWLLSSCHFEKGRNDGEGFLRESGFSEMPIMCPRWFAGTDETYATSWPALDALGDMKQLQLMQKRHAQAVEKTLKPPLQASSELRTQKVSDIPGDITYVSDFERGGVKPIHEVKPDLQWMLLGIQDIRNRITEAFLNDAALMTTGIDARGSQPPTAEEVRARLEEKQQVFGPVLEITATEFLDPFIDREFGILQAMGAIPPAPDVLQGSPLKVEYTSDYARAQKLVGIMPKDRLMIVTLPLLEPYPELRHKIDVFALVDDYADGLGVNPKIIRSNEDAQALADGERQAAAQQQEAETVLKGAQAAKQLGTTPMQGDTALNSILQGAAA